MTASPNERSPSGRAGASGIPAGERRFHVQSATAEPLLQRLDAVQKSGNGYRARCPSCGGTSRKLSITQTDDRVLVYCFGGCESIAVLQAAGLTWADIMPPRHWPESPEERRHARRAIREAGWASAVAVLAMEAKVALIAARQLARWQYLSEDDDKRLAEAVKRIDHASNVLNEAAAWRPAVKP